MLDNGANHGLHWAGTSRASLTTSFVVMMLSSVIFLLNACVCCHGLSQRTTFQSTSLPVLHSQRLQSSLTSEPVRFTQRALVSVGPYRSTTILMNAHQNQRVEQASLFSKHYRGIYCGAPAGAKNWPCAVPLRTKKKVIDSRIPLRFSEGSVNDGQKSDKSLLRKILSGTVGRIWKAVLYFWKLVILRPLQFLKTLTTGSGKEKTSTDEEQSTASAETDAAVENTDEEPSTASAETAAAVEKEDSEKERPIVVDETEEMEGGDVDVVDETEEMEGGDVERLAESSPDIDLSGNWKIIVSEDFKKQYDEYLEKLGQPLLVRSIALSLIGMTAEETRQTESGRSLFIRGTTPRGFWERTLVSSGYEDDSGSKKFKPVLMPIETADAEPVKAEAWWEEGGTVHRSWLRGAKNHGGGDFESKRYLEQNGDVLVCESVFHPGSEEREKAAVTWKFLRDGAELEL